MTHLPYHGDCYAPFPLGVNHFEEDQEDFPDVDVDPSSGCEVEYEEDPEGSIEFEDNEAEEE